MLLLHSTCDDLMRFLPNVDFKIKIFHHITCTTVLPIAASKTEKSTDNPQLIAQKTQYKFSGNTKWWLYPVPYLRGSFKALAPGAKFYGVTFLETKDKEDGIEVNSSMLLKSKTVNCL